MQVHQGRRPVVAALAGGVARDLRVRVVVVAGRICNIASKSCLLYPIRPHAEKGGQLRGGSDSLPQRWARASRRRRR